MNITIFIKNNRSVRPDDLHHLILQFVSKVLGKKYENQNSINAFPTINERSLKENTIARTILYFTDGCFNT